MNELLIKLFGLIFLLASFHRMYFTNETLKEINNLNLPKYFINIIIISELIFGIILLSNVNNEKKNIILKILFYSIIFMGAILIYNNYDNFIKTYKDLWTYQPNALSIWYHLLYLFIFYLLLNYKLVKIIK